MATPSWSFEDDAARAAQATQPQPSHLAPLPTRRRKGPRKPPAYQKGWNGDLDSWDLEDPNYSDDAWYTASRGADKTSRQINLRIPEYLGASLDQLVARGTFPAVRTPQDFIRSALVHELHRRLGEITDDSFVVEMSAHTDLAEINAIRAENEAKRAFVHYCRDELAEIEGNPSMVRKVLERVYGAIEGGQYDGALLDELHALVKKHAPKPRIVDLTDRSS